MSWCNVRDARCGRSALEWWWQGHGKTKQNKKKLGSNSKTQQGTKRTCSKTVAKSDCCLEDSRVDAVLVQSPLGNQEGCGKAGEKKAKDIGCNAALVCGSIPERNALARLKLVKLGTEHHPLSRGAHHAGCESADGGRHDVDWLSWCFLLPLLNKGSKEFV